MSRLESVLVDPVICATDVLRHGTRSDPNPSLKPPRQMEVCDVDWIKQTQQCPARSTLILQSTCNDTILARKKKNSLESASSGQLHTSRQTGHSTALYVLGSFFL